MTADDTSFFSSRKAMGTCSTKGLFPLVTLSDPSNFIINYNMKWPLESTISRWFFMENVSYCRSDFTGIRFCFVVRNISILDDSWRSSYSLYSIYNTNTHLTVNITFFRPVTELRDVFPCYWFLMSGMLEGCWWNKGRDLYPDPKFVLVRKISSTTCILGERKILFHF